MTNQQNERAPKILEFEARLALAMQTTQTIFWEINLTRQLYFTYVASHGVCKEYQSEWLEKKTLATFMHPDDIDNAHDVIMQALENDGKVIDVRCRILDLAQREEWEWVVFSGRKIKSDSFANYETDDGITTDDVIAGSVQSIAALHEVESNLSELTLELESRVVERTAELNRSYQEVADGILELQQAQAQLVESEKMAALGGMVAGVAHEVNTPLGICVTALSHLQTRSQIIEKKYKEGNFSRKDLESLFAETNESIDLALSNVSRASELIKSFKQVSVEQSSELSHGFELVELLSDTLETLKPKLKNKPFILSFIKPAPIEMRSFPGAISQIIINLVLNSLTHAFIGRDTGEMCIEVSLCGDDEILILYKDNGKGVVPENLFKLFEPFYTTNRSGGNTGLGMHIVYNLITQKLKGQIIANSWQEQGIEFYIRLPRDIDLY